MARLDHPNIVSIYDVGEQDGLFYVVLEYVDGGDLSQRLRDRAWPPDEAARLVATLARAVDYAHSLGILHRDLKPSNILFDTEWNAQDHRLRPGQADRRTTGRC